jgi:HEAT repeat protein
MREHDVFYLHLLQACQSADLQRRLAGLEDLYQHEYLDLVEAQFLLDRLNSTSHVQEQRAILELMCLLRKPLPIDALMAILADRETSTVYLRSEVAHTLAFVKAEEALDLLLQLLQDPEEDIFLREMITYDLPRWEERVPRELLLTLLTDPALGLCDAALKVLRDLPPQLIPLEMVLPYCRHEEKYLREAAIKTLIATEQRAPIDPILSALADPEPEVRAAASHACIPLVEWFPDQIPLELLLQALHDEYAAVREDALDALGKIPLRIPVEPVIAALTDPVSSVRCAAIETLGPMAERVPSSIYSTLREMSGSDDSAHVRQRATRTLLLLHGLTPGPLTLPTFDLTLEELGE